MRQERKDTLKGFEKFEDGVLRADACMERHATSRDFQYRTSFEDLLSYSFGSSALWEERKLMGDVHRLISLGIRPSGSESLEDFAERHKDLLGEAT